MNTIKSLMESLDVLSARKEISDINKKYVDIYSEDMGELLTLSSRITKFVQVDGKIPELKLSDEELGFLSDNKAFVVFYGGGNATHSIDAVAKKIKEHNARYTDKIREINTALVEIDSVISQTTKDENQIDFNFDIIDDKNTVSDTRSSGVKPKSSTPPTPEEIKKSKPTSATPKEVDKFVKQFKNNIISYGVNKTFLKSDDSIRSLNPSIKKSALATLDCSAEIKLAISTIYSI